MEAHHALARRVAEETAVLLNNEGDILPLSPGAQVAVIGDVALTPRYQGAGSSLVNPTRLDRPVDLFKESGLVVAAVAQAALTMANGQFLRGLAGLVRGWLLGRRLVRARKKGL